MRLYSLLARLGLPRSYLGKILFISFCGVHVPLLGLVSYLVAASPLSWSEVLPIMGVLLIATLIGTAMTLAALYALLAPMRRASAAMRHYLVTKTVSSLPTTFPDEAGRLMADVQEGITRLDSALDAAYAARDSATEERRVKFELLSRMSHELRTPLNAIIGFSEVMQHEMLGPLGTPHYVGYANDINVSGANLLQLVQGMLDLSAVEAGTYEVEADPVDIAEVVQAAVALKHMQAEEAGIRLQFVERLTAPPKAAVDSRAIKQMVLHLISSVAVSAPRGSVVTLVLEAHDGTVSIRCASSAGGFTRDDVPAALNGCFAGASLPPMSAGSVDSVSVAGFGLTLVRSLAQLNGGALKLCNLPDGGHEAVLSLHTAGHKLPIVEELNHQALPTAA